MYPFLEPAAVAPVEISGFAEAHACFEVQFRDVGCFGGEVAYLVPEPSEMFVGMTKEVEAIWGTRPYDGQFEDPVPHLTIGRGGRKSRWNRSLRRLAPCFQSLREPLSFFS
jgi:2'-5' RNA ligase